MKMIVETALYKSQAIKSDIKTESATLRQINEAVEVAQNEAAAAASKAAQSAAEAWTAINVAEKVTQNFWVDDSGVAGELPTGSVYITTTPKVEYCNAPSGRATIITSTGFIMQESTTVVTISEEVVEGAISEFAIDEEKFRRKVSALDGVYLFSYESEDWKYNEETVAVEDYGVNITGSVEPNTKLEISLTVGTTETKVLTAFTSEGDVISSGNYIGHNQNDTEINYEISDATISSFEDIGMDVSPQEPVLTTQNNMNILAKTMLKTNATNNDLDIEKE